MPGITGQFFRQFALTISAAMVISAINAMTLTPSRAVTIFKTQEGAQAGHHQREALPWWIFAILGGALALHVVPASFEARLGLADEEAARWLTRAIFFVPGAIVGGVFGWFLIRPVNAVLSWIFRGFNRFFDRLTEGYGWMVGNSLRLSAMVLLIYVGLLGLTGWSMTHAPTGFIPIQDQGYLLVNVQMPDSWSVQETQKVMARIDKIARGDKADPEHYPGVPGISNTITIAGQSFLLNANGSNFGSAFIILDDFASAEARAGMMRRYKETPAQALGGDRGRSCRRLSSAADPGSGKCRRVHAPGGTAGFPESPGFTGHHGQTGPGWKQE